jgi:8-amino-7-oxononanoate synthase
METAGGDARRLPESALTTGLEHFASQKLEAIAAKGLERRLAPTARDAGLIAWRGGKRLLSFSCNDYLGLSQHKDVIAAAIDATRKYGAGAGASRFVTGNHPLYEALEAELARFKGAEAAIVFGSGYLANIGIIPALVGPGDLILGDELMHACLHAGAKLSGAKLELFPHNDAMDVEARLRSRRRRYRHVLILTEGVFSMDGDRAPVTELSGIANQHDAWLMVDDAHAFGVLNQGRGSAAGEVVPLAMGTLSKAVGSYGGYLCTSRTVAQLIRHRSRSLIYSTGLPPCVLAAARTALSIIVNDPALTFRPLHLARRFTQALGLKPAESAVVPLILGAPSRALEASSALADKGFLVVAIRPPTVPEGTSRLRFSFSAAHREEDVERLIEAVIGLGLPRQT